MYMYNTNGNEPDTIANVTSIFMVVSILHGKEAEGKWHDVSKHYDPVTLGRVDQTKQVIN